MSKLTGTGSFLEARKFFEANGMYTKALPGTYQFTEYWNEEVRRCKEGYSIGGFQIPGTYYFYLNYFPMLGKDEKTGRKTKIFPRFTDVDLEYFSIVERARKEGKGVIMTKPRRTGFSYKNAALVVHEYNFHKEAKCVIGAYESKLSENTMNMALEGLNFLNKNTVWFKPRNPDTREHVQARHQKVVNGVPQWVGYNSEIRRLTFKDNPFSSIGLSANIFLFEEAGLFANIKESYNISEPTWKDGDSMVGIPLIYGTAGDMDKGSLQFAEMFYNPEKFNLLAFDNIWDKERVGTKCGWFVPASRQRFGSYPDPNNNNKLTPMVDVDGNSNEELATLSIMKFRETKKGDMKAYRDSITQYPLTTQEAFLVKGSNIFPTELAQERKAELETTKSITDGYWNVDLKQTDSGVTSSINMSKEPIVKFPLNANDDKEGCIQIFEQPYTEKPQYGVYIAGCLTPGEKVLTEKGLKNVEDITYEDKLINKDGEFVNINTLLRYDKIDENVYNVTMSNTCRSTNFTSEHPLYVSDSIDEEFNFTTVNKVKVGQWTKYPNIYNKEKVIDFNLWDRHLTPKLKKIENPLMKEDFWWFVGMWLGDGFSSKNGKNFTNYMCFGEKNSELVVKYKRVVSELFNRKAGLKSANKSNALKFECTQLFNFLEENFGKYANGKFIKEWVKYIPNNLKKQLILGYLDSDGSTYKDRTFTHTSFVSINKNLLFDIQDILFSLGIISNFNIHSKSRVYNIGNKTGNSKESYHLQINQTESKKLADLYNSNFESRKLKLLKTIEYKQTPRKNTSCILSKDNKYIFIRIKNIVQSTYTGVVYNFDCETHTFIVPYCTTHNCDPYDDDDSSTDSLGSIFIMNTLTDRIVAEYTGRPQTAREFYEICRKLLIYYNAIANYENNKKGLFAYFDIKNCLHLLCDTPQILKDQQVISIIRSTGNTSKGTNATDKVNSHARRLIREYMLDQAYNKEAGITNTHVIPSIPLLSELIYWNADGNFDRVSALGMMLILKQDRAKIVIEEMEEENDKFQAFFNRYYK